MRKIVLVTVLAAALGMLTAAMASAGAGNTVKAAGNDFTPKRIVIDKGEKVTWKRVSGIHTVTFKDGKLDEPLDGSQSVKRSFAKAGTYRYMCEIHGDEGMKGKVIVR